MLVFVKFTLVIKGFRIIFFIFFFFIIISRNVSSDMSSGLLQVFVKLGEPTRNFELRPFIESTGVTWSDSVNHNRVQVLRIPVFLLACGRDWICNLQLIVSLEAKETNAHNCYTMCPAGNNKDEDNSPKTLNDKNH